MLKLYFAPGSSSMAPHIALHEIGVPFESRPVSFKRDETRAPAFLAINPEGKVPTLLIDGRVLTEVAAILFYLARRFPQADLLPVATWKRRPRSSRGCRSSPPPFIRRGGRAWNAVARCSPLPSGGWETRNGRSSVTRSPISICFGYIGALSTPFILRPMNFPAFRVITSG